MNQGGSWTHMNRLALAIVASVLTLPALAAERTQPEPEIVQYRSGDLTLRGELFRPPGTGPFPAVLYNHGSAPGMQNSEASRLIAPLFVAQGWIFFMPYRRGQGLNERIGAYIGTELQAARRRGNTRAAGIRLVELM
jgi:dienelactone hydrolase